MGIVVNVLPMYGTPTGKCPFHLADHQRFREEIEVIETFFNRTRLSTHLAIDVCSPKSLYIAFYFRSSYPDLML